jgi:hypothetical protein
VRRRDGSLPATNSTRFLPRRVNLRGLFTELAKAVPKLAGGVVAVLLAPTPATAVGGWGTIFSASGEAAAALANVGTLTEADRAYILVERALAAAIAELVVEHRSLLGDLSTDKPLLDDLWAEEEKTKPKWHLAPDFIERPREIELVRQTPPVFEKWLHANGLKRAQAQTTAERLPTYFCLCLQEELTRHAGFYEPLIKMLKGEAAALNREAWAWDRYRAEIIREPQRPLFDETFGLDKVYVPLRAKWFEVEARSGDKKEYEVGLDGELTHWFEHGDPRDTLRVLSGEPGSGKSSTAKMWAAAMAEAHPGCRVVFVPLHRFGYKGDLRDGLKTYLKEEARIEADLLDPHCADRVLLFFDGLDELAMQGKSARAAAVAFVREVNKALET